MKSSRQLFGRAGEELAAKHLQKSGIEIIERNARVTAGEIDIVACDGELILLVEVRARRGDRYGTSLESIGPGKARRMVSAAYQYLLLKGWLDRDWRIDVIAVSMSSNGELLDVEHVPGAIEQ